MPAIQVELPVRTVSEPNARTHWAPRARRQSELRGVFNLAIRSRLGASRRPDRAAVTLTRIAPRTMDSDNLAASLKAVRDGVADALGIDDGDARLTWAYAQERGPNSRYFAVRVRIESVP